MDDSLVETFKKFHEIYANEEDEQLVRLAAGELKNLMKYLLKSYLADFKTAFRRPGNEWSSSF